jgi:hypothetical protein
LQQNIDAGASDKAGGNEGCERNDGKKHGCLLNVVLFLLQHHVRGAN